MILLFSILIAESQIKVLQFSYKNNDENGKFCEGGTS